jgi:hypothetical protein
MLSEGNVLGAGANAVGSSGSGGGCGGAVAAVDESKIDYRALYFQEAEKNKQLLQWIVQLQSNLSMRLQMMEPRAAPGLPPPGTAPINSHAAAAGGSERAAAPAAPASASAPVAGRAAVASRPGEAPGAGAKTPHSTDGTRSSPDCQQPGEREEERKGSQERAAAVGSGNLARIVSNGAASSGSSSASPALSHRGSTGQDKGQENGLAPEASQIDLARTTCSKCGQAFAFCAAFLSRHDFLVMPCPKCRCAAAIPPTPLAPTPSANAGRPVLWQEASNSMGVLSVSRGGGL